MSSSVTWSPGIACAPEAQAPKSTSLQRSLQKGRYGNEGVHSTGRLQVGHLVVAGMRRIGQWSARYGLAHTQVVSKNFTSVVDWAGRELTSVQFRKRMLQR